MAPTSLSGDYRSYAKVIDDFVASFAPGYVDEHEINPWAYDDWMYERHKDPLIVKVQSECGRVGQELLSNPGTRPEGYAILSRLAAELRQAADLLDTATSPGVKEPG